MTMKGVTMSEQIVYGYNTKEKREFTCGIRNLCECINSDEGFSDDYYVFTTAQEREEFINNKGG